MTAGFEDGVGEDYLHVSFFRHLPFQVRGFADPFESEPVVGDEDGDLPFDGAVCGSEVVLPVGEFRHSLQVGRKGQRNVKHKIAGVGEEV